MCEPLAGHSIVITAPAAQAASLAGLIRQQGGQPILFPLLAIVPLDDYTEFDDVVSQLDHYDWAIFISGNAVRHSLPRLLQAGRTLPPRLRYAAIGLATAAELGKYGINKVLTPSERFDSEQLLALPEMQQMRGRRVLIFRGQGGRELLASHLRARGAEVVYAECYRRMNPQMDTGDFARLWQNDRLHAWVVTSSEALRHLFELAGEAEWPSQTLLCVNHARIAEDARRRGLRVAVAQQPGDDAMLQCLISHLNNGQYDHE